jgi:predicted DNA-binding transcriptional regulator YafY
MPSNKNAILRYRIIDGCLTNTMHPFPSVDYIREKIENQLQGEISISMIRKDFASMKQIYSAPIKFNKTRDGYYYSEKGFSIKEFPLTTEEIAALDFSTALLNNLKDTQLFRQFENAINKLTEGYRISKILGKSERQLIQVEEPLKTHGHEWLEQLLDAIIYKKAVTITYTRYGGVPKEHVFSPCILKEYHNRWYVVGYSTRVSDLLVMALDRIKNIENSNLAYAGNVDFNSEDFFKYSFGITQIHGAKPEKILLSFTPMQAQYILSQPLHHSQKLILENDHEIHIELELYITQELIMSILGYGVGVKVLKPLHFKRQIKELIEQMLLKYK